MHTRISCDAASSPDRGVAAPSLVALLHERVAMHADRPALTTPAAAQFVRAPATAPSPQSWTDVASAALRLAGRLEAEGLSRGDRIAHLGPPTADWVLNDLACLLSGIVPVALHVDMELAAQRQWCVDLAVKALVVTGHQRDRLPTMPCPVLDLRHDRMHRLLAEQPPYEPGRLLGDLSERVAACDPDSEAVILFSSGTTGRGRGIVHSQRSLASNAISAAGVFLEEPEDVRLAWLPMSHSLARTGDLGTALVRGACLAIVEDRMRLLEAAQEVSPTVILGVPAFYERIERAIASGTITDLPASLGGRVRVCVSGGAPLRQRTAAAFAKAGVPLVEGYGLAEAGPVVSLASPRNQRRGCVGPPIAGVQVRQSTDGVLEVQSPGLALGAIEAGATSLSPLTDDGWLSTGDRGAIDHDGQLQVFGRAVETLVLSGGEKLPPSDVEAALAEDPAIAQVCVIGRGLRKPLAIIVPEPEVVRRAVRILRLIVTSRKQALQHPRLLAWFARRVAWRQQRLPTPWQVGHLLLLGRSFDPHTGEMTASMKLRRNVIADHFQKETAALAETPAQLPPGMTAINRPSPPAATSHPAADCLWQPSLAGGFAAAAESAAASLPPHIAAVEADAVEMATRLRDEGLLFDADGRLSRSTEEALATTGLFGLAVPRDHGGCGSGMQDLCRVISRLGTISPTSAGMLAVHSTIGAVWALRDFGSPQQQQRHLPQLARGTPLSIFAATEPDAGCDLGRVSTTLERRDGRLFVSGHKLFITGATHGRLVKLLARDAANSHKPVVVLVQLPPHDTDRVRLERCQLHPLKHAHNQAIVLRDFEVHADDVLTDCPQPRREPDAMRIVWHGLNRGRVTLAAQAVGTLSLMLDEATNYARARVTWGQPIASRELIQGRVARIAAARTTCEAVTSWAATAIDAGGTGELEAIVAKVTASGLVRDAAADAYGIHGGRAFLLGHPLGDSLHDHFAVNTYEGESGLLELALFKGLLKHHPLHATRHRSLLARVRPMLGLAISRRSSAAEDRSILNARFRSFATTARRGLATAARQIERALRQHGRSLADRQLLVGHLAARVREQLVVLAVAHHADRVLAAKHDLPALSAAETSCRLGLARAQGRHLTAHDLSCIAETGKLHLMAQ